MAKLTRCKLIAAAAVAPLAGAAGAAPTTKADPLVARVRAWIAAQDAADAANAINGASNAADVAGPGARATTDIVATTNGLVNVRSTIDRIKAGDKLPHRHDGSVFQNREGLLPKQIDGYYREFVHPTPGVKGPGAQRVIQGQNGELYYSPDHYRTFVPLN